MSPSSSFPLACCLLPLAAVSAAGRYHMLPAIAVRVRMRTRVPAHGSSEPPSPRHLATRRHCPLPPLPVLLPTLLTMTRVCPSTLSVLRGSSKTELLPPCHHVPFSLMYHPAWELFSSSTIAAKSSSRRQPASLHPNPRQAANQNHTDPLSFWWRPHRRRAGEPLANSFSPICTMNSAPATSPSNSPTMANLIDSFVFISGDREGATPRLRPPPLPGHHRQPRLDHYAPFESCLGRWIVNQTWNSLNLNMLKIGGLDMSDLRSDMSSLYRICPIGGRICSDKLNLVL
jgi:hypothetical protein